MIQIEPDLTCIIVRDPDAALARGLARNSGEDRFEDMGAAFQHKLRAGFLALAKDYPTRCHLIDGHRDSLSQRQRNVHTKHRQNGEKVAGFFPQSSVNFSCAVFVRFPRSSLPGRDLAPQRRVHSS